MKFLLFVGLVLSAAAFGQSGKTPAPAPVPAPAAPAAPLKPDTVVATIDGRKFTAAEFDAIADSFQGMRQNMTSNPQTFLERFGVLMTLGKLAETKGLDKQTPIKERLEYSRLQILWQALIDYQYNEFAVTAEEAKKYYEANKDNFSSVKIKAIYLPFSPAPPPQKDPKAKKVLSEPEALAQAESIVKQARGGADFVKLVKEFSQEPTSAAKDGDFGTFKKSDKIPDHIKTAIFALKQGDVSGPVKQPNGYYVFYAVEAGEQDYAHAEGTIISEVRDRKLQEWLQGIGKSTKVSVENESYFKPAAPAVK